MDWRYHEFTRRPLSDSCWSVQTGPDGRVYIACCTEHTGGESATVVRYNDDTDTLEYLFDVDEVTGDLRDSGRATQCKIHYSFIPDPARGRLYAATHLSGPPKGETSYNPWASWNDPARAFRGAYLITYDTTADQIADARLMIPKEGCRCLAHDADRGLLYAVTYPRDHFVSYDLARGTLTDYGRIGSVNTQCLVTDRRGRVFFFDDQGFMVRFDPEKRRLEELSQVYPHASYQSAWHGVLYDAVPDPQSGSNYMVPWKAHPRLARYWPEEGPEGRLEDLGPVTQDRDVREVMNVNLDHVGGLVWGPDQRLYLVKSKWTGSACGPIRKEETASCLTAYDPADGSWTELGGLSSPVGRDHYISRGALSAQGTLVFGKIMAAPAGVYRVRLPELAGPLEPAHYLRPWG